MQNMVAWNVYLNGKLIDTVFYNLNCDKQYVFNSLIEHYDYNPAIIIKKQ